MNLKLIIGCIIGLLFIVSVAYAEATDNITEIPTMTITTTNESNPDFVSMLGVYVINNTYEHITVSYTDHNDVYNETIMLVPGFNDQIHIVMKNIPDKYIDKELLLVAEADSYSFDVHNFESIYRFDRLKQMPLPDNIGRSIDADNHAIAWSLRLKNEGFFYITLIIDTDDSRIASNPFLQVKIYDDDTLLGSVTPTLAISPVQTGCDGCQCKPELIFVSDTDILKKDNEYFNPWTALTFFIVGCTVVVILYLFLRD